ncbi:Ser/Thr protein kinase RdoA (MazF antagonist) [Thermobifida halotolerans]|uniref:aminoglycoside phosphotransferase family protein n=1 Tax=Thermobifida halotolerans TaxID=483545 RepID=UPI001FB2AA55|nr:aminoglycoside phosphotransferase family protein [Thermobifida halotolerans]
MCGGRGCSGAGITTDTPELLRLGERAVLTLADGRVIARVERGADRYETAAREVAVARWLDREGVRVGRPLGGEQPYRVRGTVVTLWEKVDGKWTVPAELAAILARLHRLAPPPLLCLPDLDPFDRTDERIAHAALAPAHKDTLRRIAEQLRGEYEQVRPVLSRCVIHGDANIGNVLATPDGVVLFDLDGVCLGPPEWDLVLTALYRDLGWHTDTEYAAFCDVYGFDVNAWDGYAVFKRIRELRMVSWLAQKAGESPRIDEEIHRRIADLADPSRPRHWHPY